MKNIIQFTKFKAYPLLVSLAVFALGLVFTIQNGFNLGVDFEAGLNLQITSDPPVSIGELRAALADYEGLQVQELGNNESFSVRVRDNGSLEDFSNVTRNSVVSIIEEAFDSLEVEILGENYVEPRFAADLTLNTTILVLAAMLCILVYLWIRFRFQYALSSLAALVHDISFMVLFIGTFQIELTASTIAAVLTIIGYSLNDTIVIFDRIRENEKLVSGSAFNVIVDTSITQSLSRTIITSFTTLLAVSAIYVFTTGAIQNFALNMIVGIVVGTYSSIFIASPVLLTLHNAGTKRNAHAHGASAQKKRSEVAKSGEARQIEQSSSSTAKEISKNASEAVLREIRQKRASKKKNRS